MLLTEGLCWHCKKDREGTVGTVPFFKGNKERSMRRKGLVWLTGILMVAVFALSSLAGWLVWQRQEHEAFPSMEEAGTVFESITPESNPTTENLQ